MKKKWMSTILQTSLVSACCLISTVTLACTGMQLKASDGSYINGRTVEFAAPIQLSVLVIPRNYAFTGTLPDGTKGISYMAKYAVIGANTFGAPAVVDGVNEKGLSAAAFYFPGYAEYTQVNQQNKSKGISPTEFVNWVLTQFATTDEVKNGLDNVVITPTAPNGWGGVPPFHYVVYDKSGKSIVIEPLKGKLVVYDNPVGVMTNSPTFDWHLTNLSNYINLTPMNTPDKSIDGMKLMSFGQGSGLHGLPGDFTPPSRFVRSAIFSASATPTKDAGEAVLQAFHLLNNFDIPAGAVREIAPNGKMADDITLATTVKDPQNMNYYFRTYDDQNIKMVSLGSFDLNAKDLQTVSMNGMQPVTDVSAQAKKVNTQTMAAKNN